MPCCCHHHLSPPGAWTDTSDTYDVSVLRPRCASTPRTSLSAKAPIRLIICATSPSPSCCYRCCVGFSIFPAKLVTPEATPPKYAGREVGSSVWLTSAAGLEPRGKMRGEEYISVCTDSRPVLSVSCCKPANCGSVCRRLKSNYC